MKSASQSSRPPGNLSSTFFGNRGFETYVISEDAVVLDQGCPYKKRETWSQARRCRKAASEDGGRDWRHVSTSQGTPRTAGSHQKPRERHGADPPAGAKMP